MAKFKMRAECFADINAFIGCMTTLSGFKIATLDDVHPDCEIEFNTSLNLGEIRDLIRDIDDGHVMLQTVQPIESYTGEREDIQ